MSDFVIVTDTGCDLASGAYAEHGIGRVPLSFSFAQQEPTDRTNVDSFYAVMGYDNRATTSQANPAQFIEIFEPILQSGRDVLYLSLSSGLSGTFDQSLAARRDLEAKYYPARKIICVDDRCVAGGLEMLVLMASKKQQSGASLEETAEYIEEIYPTLTHDFTVGDLEYLKRGGRISAFKKMAAGLIGIHPILHVDDEGKLVPRSNVRGRKKLFRAMGERIIQNIKDPSQGIIVSHGNWPAFAEEFVAYLKTLDELSGVEITVGRVRQVIGSHTGPEVMAIFYVGHER